MTRANCGSAPAIDSANGLLGILTECDRMEGVIMAKGLNPAGRAKAKAKAKSMPPHQRCLPPGLRVSDALLLDVNAEADLGEFDERVDDAMG